jgi:phosphatidylserine/phosphatidylglycerophosphate/cardiolipin synthase-like enzyme
LELIVLPSDGLTPVLKGIARVKKTLDIVIFRFNLKEVERAIEKARERGVVVRVLIASTNSGGEKQLRQLELRMLDKGVIVTRTANDLIRYHGKLLIIDREELHVYGYNFTAMDHKSRSFGLISRHRRTVQEALRMFEADVLRQEFQPSLDGFVVSPENAREQLATFIKRARKYLAIYDVKVSDPQMIRLLHQRAKAGVDVRIIGKMSKGAGDLKVQKMPDGRMHVRAMIRDGEVAFLGSQSLRSVELDGRREVGLIARDPAVVKRLMETFESDWAKTDLGQLEVKQFEKEQKQASEEPEVAVATSR